MISLRNIQFANKDNEYEMRKNRIYIFNVVIYFVGSYLL